MSAASAVALAAALLTAGPWIECRVTATPLSFGDYDTFSSFPLDATGELLVACQPGGAAAPRIRLDAGLHSGGSFDQRRMRAGQGRAALAYGLYRDAARTEPWGDGTGNTAVVRGAGRHIVHGRIPAQQSVPPGSYSDTVTVTVEW